MNNTAPKSPTPSPNSAKHLSRLESTAPKKATKMPAQGASRRIPISDVPPEEPVSTPKRKSRWWIWLIIALLVVGAAAAVYFLFLRPEKPTTPAPAAEEVLVYGLKDPVIFENEECALIVDAIGEKGDYLELDVRCINKIEDTLSFTWDSTCINNSMFDPLWNVYVQGKSTLKSSITFPLTTLDGYELLPANQIKFVLGVHNETKYNKLVSESSKHILTVSDILEDTSTSKYRKIKGYDDYLFSKDVKTDKNGRPYYVNKDKNTIYFDEIYDRNGKLLYPSNDEKSDSYSFYNDKFGRPYYFNESTDTVYYDGYGFAFYDEENNKYYYYDENGLPTYYGHSGIAEPYTGSLSNEQLNQEVPAALAMADGAYIVHNEFAIYPTGKDGEEATHPARITTSREQVYWNGEKGTFIVLGGEVDEFKGYIVHTFLENNSDSYIYFGLADVVVNGVDAGDPTATVLRPHSTAYKDYIIPIDFLKEQNIQTVSEIDFRVYAVGENLSVPLYPIEWMAN